MRPGGAAAPAAASRRRTVAYKSAVMFSVSKWATRAMVTSRVHVEPTVAVPVAADVECATRRCDPRNAMDWNDLRYLLAVRRRGTLAGASKDLQVTKGTVSRRLAALEEALGGAVVERRPAGLVLTPAG